LSGTPIISSPADLFPMLNRMLPRSIATTDENGDERRTQYNEFIVRYCTFKTVHLPGGRTMHVPAGAQNVEELRSKLVPHMSRRRRRDTLSLPALRLETFALSVKPTAELTAALKMVPQELLGRLQTASDDELLLLLQRHVTHLASLRRVIGVAKATAAADHIVERIAGGEDRVIGFFHHREVADVMAAQLRLADVSVGVIRGDTSAATRTQLLDAFGHGDLQVLALQSQSGSLGLNLQVCRYAAIVEPDWTAAVTEQAIARLYRAGQVRDVTIDFLMLPNSIDEHVVNVARRKAQIAADLIEQPEEVNP
jgi:SNF2 family DNA or RNA helicase